MDMQAREQQEDRYRLSRDRTMARIIASAARSEHDFGGWLAGVLASAAKELGSSYALVEGRPGSWEAALVLQLVKGTVGWDDEYLQDRP